MNLLHLKYAAEVEKTGSITKAAENLYMGQPNLSRAIGELEENLGIKIFRRTSKGIVPTVEGEEFLTYAKGILVQIEEMEAIYNREKKKTLTFKVAAPRTSYVCDAFCQTLAQAELSEKTDIVLNETTPIQGINCVSHENYNLGIIRYQSIHERYFASQLRERDLKGELLYEFDYVMLMSADHPLAQKANIEFADLKECIELSYGDYYVSSLPLSEIKRTDTTAGIDKRIYLYERASMLDILAQTPLSYMWTSPQTSRLLRKHGLVQRRCRDMLVKSRDSIIYRRTYKLSPLDEQLIENLKASVSQVLNRQYI